MFGNPLIPAPNNTQRTASIVTNRFMFIGREFSNLFGFYEWSEMGIRDIDGQVREGSGRIERGRMSQYRNRAYHPGLGRFMSEDPKLFVRRAGLGKAPDDWSFGTYPAEGEYNLFRYCGNDPIDFTDPMGLAPIGVPNDVDDVSRHGLDVLHREALSSGHGYELATSTGRENGKVFLSKEREVGKGTPYGKQKVPIPAPKPGSDKERESGLHVHRNDIQHDANDNQVQKGSLSSKGDRNWADAVKKAIYTENEKGNIKERYRPDDSKPGAGVIERWNGTKWEELPLPKVR